MNSVFTRSKRLGVLTFVCFLVISFQAFGQNINEPQILQPGQTIEVEVTGKTIERYKFDLKANEFFQVRVEQKGVDVSLKLNGEKGDAAAEMDSPNGREGFEILSFAAGKSGTFILEITNSDEKIENGIYILKRELSRAATAKDKRRVEIEKSFVEAVKAYATPGKAESAVQKFRETLPGWQELNDAEMINSVNFFMVISEINADATYGFAYFHKANSAIGESRQKGGKLLETVAGDLEKADQYFKKSEESARKAVAKYSNEPKKTDDLKYFLYSSKSAESLVAGNFANYYNQLEEPQKSLIYSKQAYSLQQDANSIETSRVSAEDKIFALSTILMNLASASEKNQLPEAFDYYEEFLSKQRELKTLNSKRYDARTEAVFLSAVATLYSTKLCREFYKVCWQKAVNYREKAIAIFREIGDKEGLASEYSAIGNVFYNLDEYFKATEYLDKSVDLYRILDDKEQLAYSLIGNASIYLFLGNSKKSMEFQDESLKLFLSVTKYKEGLSAADLTPFTRNNYLTREHLRLIIIGGIYETKNDPKAVEIYNEAMKTAVLLGNKKWEADGLSAISRIYRTNKDWNNALVTYQKAVSLYRQTDSKKDVATTLVDMATVNLESNKPQEAFQNLTESQMLFSSLAIDDGGILDNGLARTWYALGNRRMAIFYGKKLVNLILTEREKLTNFDRETQQSFVKSFEKGIRRLADWLIEDGKFAEAEKVLRLLKEEEYSDFVRRDANEIKKLKTRIDLGDDEKRAIEKYSQLTEEISRIGNEVYRLDQKRIELLQKGLDLSKTNPQDAERLKALSDKLTVVRQAFQIFLDTELVEEIGAEKKKNIETQNKKRADLKKLPAGTVTLYTVLGEDRYRVILTTPTVQIDGKYEIKDAELNQKIFAFRSALQNPQIDPRPLGKELYEILIKPIEKDLQNSGAKTLLWYLDGTLRFIPLAALSPDGKSYLIEQYQSVVLTANSENLEISKNNAKWKILGMGVSDAQKVDNPLIPNDKIEFDPLPGTKRELSEIISDETTREKSGIFFGRRFLNETFTMKNLEDTLGTGKFNAVHLASHFYLGNKTANSFLLLGDGQILSLDKIKFGDFINFSGVDIVTLSACNTAFNGNSNGAEVDSLADVIQSQGGKSVLATLWAVADESTSLLMSEFYRIKKTKPNLTKAEAIQAAQLAMISGNLKGAASGKTKGATLAGQTAKKTDQPAFETDKNAPFAHPYFWSPFVLIGNWK